MAESAAGAEEVASAGAAAGAGASEAAGAGVGAATGSVLGAQAANAKEASKVAKANLIFMLGTLLCEVINA